MDVAQQDGLSGSQGVGSPKLFQVVQSLRKALCGAGNHLPNNGKMPIKVQPPFGSLAEIAAEVEAVHQEQTMAKRRIENFLSPGVPDRHGARRDISPGSAGWRVSHIDFRRTEVTA
jgi:hypothetical protein